MAVKSTSSLKQKKEVVPQGGRSENKDDAHSFYELPDDSQRLWYAYIKAYKTITEAMDRELGGRNLLSLAEYEVVAMVDNAGGRIRFIDLAKLTLLSQSRISRQVDTLQHKGLLRREITDSDRRATFALITPQGREMLDKTGEAVVQALNTNFYGRIPEAKHKVLQELLEGFLEPHYRFQSGRILNEARVANGAPPLVQIG